MPASDYATPSSGALKLKGSAGIDKKRKKKKRKEEDAKHVGERETGQKDTIQAPTSKSTLSSTSTPKDLQSALAAEDQLDSKAGESRSLSGENATATDKSIPVGKTEAQLRYEERRRKRLEERLRREGVKTHKERVEELNRYLSNLSEHHDMYVFQFPSKVKLLASLVVLGFEYESMLANTLFCMQAEDWTWIVLIYAVQIRTNLHWRHVVFDIWSLATVLWSDY